MLTSRRGSPDVREPAAAAQPSERHLAGISVPAVSSAIGARLTATFLGFVAGIITAHELGPHGRGLLAVSIAVPALFSVLGVLGRDTASLRFAGRSHTAFRQIIRSAVLFALVAGTLIPGAWLLAGKLQPAVLLGLSPWLALLSALLCPVAALVTLLGTAEVGRGRIYAYNLVTAGAVACYLATISVLAMRGPLTVGRCIAAYAASQLTAVIAFLVLASRRVHGEGVGVPPREFRSYAWRAYLPNVAQYGMLRMDVPVIQLLSGTTAVALYAVALPFAEALLLLPVAVSLVMFPQVTSGELGPEATARISRLVLAGMAALAGVVAAAVPVIVPVVYGAAFSGSVAVTWCMLPGIVIFGLGRTVQSYLAGTDRLRPVTIASAVGVAVGLLSLAALVPRFGAAGAGAADTAGYVAYAAVITGCLRRDGPVADLVARTLQQFAGGALWSSAMACCVAAAAAMTAAAFSVVSPATAIRVLGGALLLLAIMRPASGLYLLAIAIPASQTSAGAEIISARYLPFLVIACLLGQIGSGQVVRRSSRMAVSAIALITYFTLSAALAGRGASTADLLSLAELGVLLLFLPLVTRPGLTAQRVLTVFSCSAVCVAITEIITARAFLAAAGAITTPAGAAVVAEQTGALNHNVEGALFIVALCVLLARLRRAGSGAARLVIATAVAVLLVGVAYSFSRSSYFGALAVLALFAVRRPGRGLIGAALAAGIALLLVPAAVITRIATIWHSSGQDPSTAVRLDLWSAALRMFARQPAAGVGYLHFADQLPAYFASTGNYATSVIQLQDLVYAHNTYLTVLAETGVVGGVLVGILVAAGWRASWSAARSGAEAGESALLALVGVGVCSLFGEPLFSLALLAAVMLVVLAAARTSAVAGRLTADSGTASAEATSTEAASIAG